MATYDCSAGDPLDMLAEECAELIQAIMKMRRFGPNGAPGYSGSTPTEEIKREAGDVLCAIDRLVTSGFMTKSEAILACATKHERIRALFGE